MKNLSMMTSASTSARPVWNAPKLQELGNLRNLVRVGNANGKSGSLMDGGSNCGGEAMNSGPGC
jgi:hypothetical protein